MTLWIIGTGLSRGGTMSTRTAIERLGNGPFHHMTEFFANPWLVAVWADVARGGLPDREMAIEACRRDTELVRARVPEVMGDQDGHHAASGAPAHGPRELAGIATGASASPPRPFT